MDMFFNQSVAHATNEVADGNNPITTRGTTPMTPTSLNSAFGTVPKPKIANGLNPPQSFYGQSLSSSENPITNVPDWSANSSISVTRRVASIPKLAGVNGALTPFIPSFIYRGYTTTYMEMNRFSHPNQAYIDRNHYSTPYCDAVISMPTINSMLIDMALATVNGETLEAYTSESILEKFMFDGILQTVAGSDAFPNSRNYGALETSVVTLHKGRTLIRDIWQKNIQPEVPLQIFLKKYDPSVLIQRGVKYSVDPSVESDGSTEVKLKSIIVASQKKNKPQWIYQFVPLPPYFHGYDFTDKKIEKELTYKDEYGRLETSMPISVCVTESSRTRSMLYSEYDLSVPPIVVTSMLKHVSAPTLEVYAAV